VPPKRRASRHDAEQFFAGSDLGMAVFGVLDAFVQGLGGAELRVAPSQVGWARRRGFAFLWRPDQTVLGSRGAPLVLTIALPRRDDTQGWKEVAEVRQGLWNHHLEVHHVREVDAEVMALLSEAYDIAG
jgi:hypothetical protein